MKITPILEDISKFDSVGFYDFYRAKRCILKGSRKNLVLSSELPNEPVNAQTLLGLFYHDAMELCGKVKSLDILKDSIESLITDYSAKSNSVPSLKKLGLFGNWRETNITARRVFDSFRRKSSDSHSKANAESLLQSLCGRFVGRPDLIVTSRKIANLIEFKSNDLRESSGHLKDEYREQLLFYAFLLYQNFEIHNVQSTIESVSGDKIEFEISLEAANQYYLESVERINQINELLKAASEKSNLKKISNVTEDNCQYCEKRVVCHAFLERQFDFQFESDAYIIQGKIQDKDTRALNADILKVLDENRGEVVLIKCTKGVSANLEIGKKYTLYGIRRNNTGFELTAKSQVLLG